MSFHSKSHSCAAVKLFVRVPQVKNVELHVPEVSSHVTTAAVWIRDWSVTQSHNAEMDPMRRNARTVSKRPRNWTSFTMQSL